MTSHVFTRNQSYYWPSLGVVDFNIGQKIDPHADILDRHVAQQFIAGGVLVPVDGAKGAPAAPVVEPVEEEFVPPPMVEVAEEAEEPEVAPETVSAAPRPRGRPAGRAKDAT